MFNGQGRSPSLNVFDPHKSMDVKDLASMMLPKLRLGGRAAPPSHTGSSIAVSPLVKNVALPPPQAIPSATHTEHRSVDRTSEEGKRLLQMQKDGNVERGSTNTIVVEEEQLVAIYEDEPEEANPDEVSTQEPDLLGASEEPTSGKDKTGSDVDETEAAADGGTVEEEVVPEEGASVVGETKAEEVEEEAPPEVDAVEAEVEAQEAEEDSTEVKQKQMEEQAEKEASETTALKKKQAEEKVKKETAATAEAVKRKQAEEEKQKKDAAEAKQKQVEEERAQKEAAEVKKNKAAEEEKIKRETAEAKRKQSEEERVKREAAAEMKKNKAAEEERIKKENAAVEAAKKKRQDEEKSKKEAAELAKKKRLEEVKIRKDALEKQKREAAAAANKRETETKEKEGKQQQQETVTKTPVLLEITPPKKRIALDAKENAPLDDADMSLTSVRGKLEFNSYPPKIKPPVGKVVAGARAVSITNVLKWMTQRDVPEDIKGLEAFGASQAVILDSEILNKSSQTPIQNGSPSGYKAGELARKKKLAAPK